MRVLVVSPFPVDPQLHGSRVRIAGLARGLARAGAQVTLACPWDPRQRLASLPWADELELRAHKLVANVLPLVVPARVASPLALLSLQPRGPGARRMLRGSYDVVQLELCAHVGLLRLADPRARVVYSAHNVERDQLDPGSRVAATAARRVERLERDAVRAAELVVTCSEHDAHVLADRHGATDTLVLPNGSDRAVAADERARLRPAARRDLGLADSDRAVLFVGGDAAHNRTAARFVAESVLPALGDEGILLVAGRSGEGLVAPAGVRVRSLGYVEDLRPLLAAADVAVNPVGSASGSSAKVADFLAAGLPVVATRAGARGHEGHGVVVAERERIATAVAAVLGGHHPAPVPPATWDELGARLHAEYERRLEVAARTPATVP